MEHKSMYLKRERNQSWNRIPDENAINYKKRCGKKFTAPSGIPRNSLPTWKNISLDCKLPVPDKIPEGRLNLTYGTLCQKPWPSDRRAGFQLSDPYIRDSRTAALEYNSLTDPHLADYLTRPTVARHLYTKGLVTRDGEVPCSLKAYNRYRKCLHQHNLTVLSNVEKQNSERYIRDMIYPTLHVASHMKQEKKTDNESQPRPQRRYSELLSCATARLRRHVDSEFSQSDIIQAQPEGEREFLRKVKNMMFEDCRKRALREVRQAETCEEINHKVMYNWRKLSEAQKAELDSRRQKEDDLKRERERHIREHIEHVNCQRADMKSRIREASKKRMDEIQCTRHEISRHVCVKTNRQWPLSARCPPNVLQGGVVRDCTKPSVFDNENQADKSYEFETVESGITTLDEMLECIRSRERRRRSVCPPLNQGKQKSRVKNTRSGSLHVGVEEHRSDHTQESSNTKNEARSESPDVEVPRDNPDSPDFDIILSSASKSSGDASTLPRLDIYDSAYKANSDEVADFPEADFFYSPSSHPSRSVSTIALSDNTEDLLNDIEEDIEDMLMKDDEEDLFYSDGELNESEISVIPEEPPGYDVVAQSDNEDSQSSVTKIETNTDGNAGSKEDGTDKTSEEDRESAEAIISDVNDMPSSQDEEEE